MTSPNQDRRSRLQARRTTPAPAPAAPPPPHRPPVANADRSHPGFHAIPPPPPTPPAAHAQAQAPLPEPVPEVPEAIPPHLAPPRRTAEPVQPRPPGRIPAMPAPSPATHAAAAPTVTHAVAHPVAHPAAHPANQHAPAARAAAPGHAAQRPQPAAATQPVTVIPPVPPGFWEVEMQVMVPDRAWVRILYDEAAHTYLYEVLEPVLDKDERALRRFLHDTLVRTLDGRQGRDGNWDVVLVAAIRQAIIDHSIRVSEPGVRRLEYYLSRDFLGYGPIDVLMHDPMLEDISCDGPNLPLYLFHRKYESIRSNVQFQDELELDSFVIRLAQRSRKHISIADPLLDATLPDGSRLQCTLSREVTTRGSSFTIRKFRADPMTPPDLVRFGTLSAEMAGWFWFAMEVGASFLIAGGTASGKTTTLNAVSQFIPPEKKIVSIEDTREINLSHENWIAGVTRSGFGGEVVGGKLAGTIDMYKLLEAALRQRPEYLLVGEVRGPEALTLFQAMATGHAVYSTMHADSVQSAVYRLENEPINVPRMMLQTLDILAIQGQFRRGDKLIRRLKEVTEIIGYEPETKELLTNTVFEWDPSTDTHRYLGKSYVLDHVMSARNLSEEQVEAEWRNRVRVLEWMKRQDIRHVGDVARIVSQYYRNPAMLLERVTRSEAEGHAPRADRLAAVGLPAAHGGETAPAAPLPGPKPLPLPPPSDALAPPPAPDTPPPASPAGRAGPASGKPARAPAKRSPLKGGRRGAA